MRQGKYGLGTNAKDCSSIRQKTLVFAAFAVMLLAIALSPAYAATQYHPANEVIGGTFGAGNFVFPANLTVSGQLLCTNCIGAAGVADGLGVSEIDETAVQLRVTGTCNAGSSIRVVNQDGTVTCETDDSISATGLANRLTLWSGTSGINYSESLAWDPANKRLGIGTTGPGYALDVVGSGKFSTSLGVGTGPAVDATITTGSTSGSNSGLRLLQASVGSWYLLNKATSGDFLLGTSATDNKFYITSTGNLGIGTTSPSGKLQVNGNLNMANNSIYAVVNLNGNTLSELFANASVGANAYTAGSIGWTDLLNKSTDAYDNDDSDADLINKTDNFGGDVSGVYSNLQLGSGSVGSAEIADGTVASGDVAFNYAGSGSKGGAATDVACTTCVALGTETSGTYDTTADTIADDGTIVSSEITDGTIATIDIGDNQVTNAKLASDLSSLNKVSGGQMTAATGLVTVGADLRVNGNLQILKNLTNVNVNTLVVNGTIRPSTGFGNYFDIGTDALTWKNGYFAGNVEMANLYDVDGTNFFDLSSCGTGATVTAIDATGAVTCSAINFPDTSATNELQNIFQTADAPSGTDPVADTTTDTLQFLAGSGVTITGDSAADSLTISVADTSATNELQNIFQTVDAPSGTDPVADTTTDTLQFLAGSGVTITGDSAADSITIAPDTTYMQRRVSGSCTAGNAIRVVNADGTVTCESAGGSITGTGAANRLALWTSGSNINTTEGLAWDATNKRLGIGTTAPSHKLHIVGDVNVTSDIHVKGNIKSHGADFAESFQSESELSPGDVVCMLEGDSSAVVKCSGHGQSSVVGVVSENPTIIGNSANKVAGKASYAVGVVGIVKTKVKGEVKAFDLLTTSEKQGYAEKAEKDDFGSIIGKAMEPCSGECEINVLISLM